MGALADAVKMVEERDWCVEESGESYVVAWTIGCSLFMATPPPPHNLLSYHCMFCHDMTKFYVTYHAVICHDMTICHDIKGTVLNFGTFEVYKTEISLKG